MGAPVILRIPIHCIVKFARKYVEMRNSKVGINDVENGISTNLCIRLIKGCLADDLSSIPKYVLFDDSLTSSTTIPI